MVETDLWIKIQSGYGSILIVIVLTILLSIARNAIQDFVQRLLRNVKAVPKSKRKNFSESIWKCLYYSTTCLWGFNVVISQDFFWDTRLCWAGWPNIPMSESFRWFYLMQLSFYVHSFFAHRTIEVQRSDYWPMFIHHVVASVLIAFSYYHNVFRIGGILLALHDVNDVFLESAKLGNYLKADMVSNALFATLLLSWITTRITLYPIKVISSVYSEVFYSLPFDQSWYYQVWTLFLILLFTILILNIFWFFLICRIAWNAIRHNGIKDEREEDD